MLSIVALMFTFAFTEGLILRYGSGLRSFVHGLGNRSVQKDALTSFYLVLVGFFSSVFSLLLGRILGFPLLMLPVYLFLAVYIPLLMKTLLQGWLLEADEWNSERHYSWSAAVILMYTIDLYRLSPPMAFLASLGAAASYWGVMILFSKTMEKLYFEPLPRSMRPLPLAFIVLGFIGLALAGLDGILAEARLQSLFSM